MPGATETEFFRRAEMMDTALGSSEKDDPAEVANIGFDAMIKGEGDVVSGLKNKVQSAAANVTPAGVPASQHRQMAEPAPLRNDLFRPGSGFCPRHPVSRIGENDHA